MMFRVPLRRKDNEVEVDPCYVTNVVTLSKNEFNHFSKHLLEDYDFIKENYENMGVGSDGVSHCILVLGEGTDDGILVNSEGSNYARYSAYISNARQLCNLSRYSYLDTYAEKMIKITDYCVDQAVKGQVGGRYRINVPNIKKLNGMDSMDEDLFLDMLSERDEISVDDFYDNEIKVSINDEFLIPEEEANLKVISQHELQVMMAKHFLWLNDEHGGQQADLTGYYVEQANFSNMDLSSVIMERAKFVDCNFFQTNLSFAEATHTQFCNCMMMNINGDEANFYKSDFRNCILQNSNCAHANFMKSKFVQSDVYKMNILNSCIVGTEFIDCDTTKMNTQNCVTNIEDWDVDGLFIDEELNM